MVRNRNAHKKVSRGVYKDMRKIDELRGNCPVRMRAGFKFPIFLLTRRMPFAGPRR